MSSRSGLILDRMVVEEAGPNPARLAAAIHDQLGDQSGPVPVDVIARALDIVEIRTEPLHSLEGALLTTPERPDGKILVNAKSGRRRQRFTIAHELGHFLNIWHEPTNAGGFQCSREDIQSGGWDAERDATRHTRQEAEANRFAIELLLPSARLVGFVSSEPDLDDVRSIAGDNDVSREAAARRYVECHDATTAIAFSHNGRLRYWAKQNAFPHVAFWNGEQMPDLPPASNDTKLSDIENTDAAEWLTNPGNAELSVQTLYQRDDYAMTLLILDTDREDDEDCGIEDAFDRFSRFRSDP